MTPLPLGPRRLPLHRSVGRYCPPPTALQRLRESGRVQVVRYVTFDLASPRRAQNKLSAPTNDPTASWAAALAPAPLAWAIMLVLRPYPITRGDEHTTRELVIYKILCSQKKMTAPVIEDVSPVNAALSASAATAWSIL